MGITKNLVNKVKYSWFWFICIPRSLGPWLHIRPEGEFVKKGLNVTLFSGWERGVAFIFKPNKDTHYKLRIRLGRKWSSNVYWYKVIRKDSRYANFGESSK